MQLRIKAGESLFQAEFTSDHCLALFKELVTKILDKNIPGNSILVQQDATAVELENDCSSHEIRSAKTVIPDTNEVDPSGDVIELTGYMIMSCEICGKENVFYQREPADHCQCINCGAELFYKNLSPVVVSCECGTYQKFLTNHIESMFEVKCRKCGSPVALEYVHKENKYKTIKE